MAVLARPIRVLVVDDDEDIRFIVRSLLGADGRFAVVGEAPDVAQAVDWARRAGPDLIVLDAVFPGLDGITALPLLRDAAPAACVVMLSGHDELRRGAMDGGAVAFLEKSTTLPDLPEILIEILNRAP